MEMASLAFLLTECATTTMTVGTGKMNPRTNARRMSVRRTMEDVSICALILQVDSSVAVRKVSSCLRTAPVLVSRNRLIVKHLYDCYPS